MPEAESPTRAAVLPKRVALVGPSFPLRGGISYYTTRLGSALLRAGVEVDSIGFRRQYPAWLFPGAPSAPGANDDCKAVAKSLLFGSELAPESQRLIDSLDPWSWWSAGKRIAARQPDWIVLTWWTWFWTIPFLTLIAACRDAAGRRIPLLVLCHNVVDHEGNLFKSACSRAILRRATRIFVHAASESAKVQRLIGRSADAVGFLPLYDGVPDRPNRGEARAALGLGGAAPVVLYFGIIRPYKGVEILLEALTLLDDAALRVLVVGEIWGDDSALRRRLADPRVAGRVTLVDRYVSYDEAAVYFRAADVVVLPYLEGSQSGVVPMAYAFGLPVIVSDVGGLRDVIVEGETGYLVPPGDAAALGRRIGSFFASGHGGQMSERVKLYALKLNWEEYLARLPF